MAAVFSDNYSIQHASVVDTLGKPGFAATNVWKSIIDDARLAAVENGYNVEKYRACEAIRAAIATGKIANDKPVVTMLAGAGLATPPATAGTAIAGDVVKRVAALEMLRHLWLLAEAGSHKLMVLSLPNGYRDWPARDLAGKTFGGIAARIDDESSHFSATDRDNMSAATSEGLKWVHKAMLVAAAPATPENQVILKRWFADANTTPEQLNAAASKLNEGLKKIAAVINSTFLLFVDMPKDRDDIDEAGTTAFVFGGEKINVVYVEAAFFTTADLFKDLKNWTRIVIHELSHREVDTDDHRYRHNPSGLKPDAASATFTAAHALDNADSWALFCMDCAGQMTAGDYALVKV